MDFALRRGYHDVCWLLTTKLKKWDRRESGHNRFYFPFGRREKFAGSIKKIVYEKSYEKLFPKKIRMGVRKFVVAGNLY